MNERIFAVAHLADQVVLYLLLGLCLMSLYMIIDRYFFLKNLVQQCLAFKKDVAPLIQNANFNALERMVHTDSLPNRTLKMALQHCRTSATPNLTSLVESIKNLNKPQQEKYLGFLATVGSNAPYIGLFGTVLGIMKSFNDMAQTTAQGQGSVMAGISSALIATAAGLLAAIPAVLAYNYFQKQVKYVNETLDLVQHVVEVSQSERPLGVKHG
ncbi:MAG: MotA/TolQ/ExbB proton channel family protein [Bdellovibrionaceae bacterium]|nr:MotA/TolQ/ExbB proton channel family protein [Pseudobdellovibrionaceae bacterium]